MFLHYIDGHSLYCWRKYAHLRGESRFRGNSSGKVLITTLLLLYQINANAGYASGRVRDYTVGGNGLIYFSLDSEHTNRPSCATDQWGQFVISLVGPNATSGKAAYAALLAAYESNRPITVTGTNACDLWGDRETADSIATAGR
jgi:hypothetical protein